MLNPFFGENCQNNAKVPKKFIPARTKILSYWYYVVMFPSSDFKLPRSTCKVWHPNDEIVDRPQNGKPWIPGFSTYPLSGTYSGTVAMLGSSITPCNAQGALTNWQVVPA
jgi:hypothetical protein